MSVVAVDGFVDISIDLGERLGVDDADLDAEAREALAPILQEMVRVWREDLLSTWPVDTGRSQASWTDRWEGLVWVLRNPVEYAEYVHNAGETVPVWEFLEARQRVSRIRLRRGGGRQRSLLGFAARTAAARAVSSRVFAAQAAAFRVVSSRERTRRQLQRLDAA
jgi:hypothetical protein